MRNLVVIGVAFLFLAMGACRKNEPAPFHPQQNTYKLELPEGFPEPVIPEDNALTFERIALGKKLFFDTRLSADGSISCGSCHLQDLAFSDGLVISEGVGSALGKRNAPGLFNLAWHDRLMADGGVPDLELQVLVPIHSEIEMNSHILEIADELNEDVEYAEMAQLAYGQEMSAFVITHSIASFERTLISGNSRYDQYLNGNETALNESEKRGMQLFFSDRTDCGSCHGGFLRMDNSFHNVGLSMEYTDWGRELVSLDPADRGKFKTPSLRNVDVTAPYMHDGSLGSLEEVVEHFNSGAYGHENQDHRIRPLDLNEQEKLDLVNFMRSLTDQEFLENPAYRQ